MKNIYKSGVFDWISIDNWGCRILPERVDLFGSKELTDEDNDDLWHSISASPHFEQYMPFSRFKEFR
jgi:hypothetical protein